MQNLINVLKTVDDDYLTGLGNKGLVKRAYKDLESAEISAEYSESSVEVSVSGEKCIIVSPLGGSKCSCPSRSICRHVITAILWLKGNLPADNDSTESENTNNEPTIPEKPSEDAKPNTDKPSVSPELTDALNSVDDDYLTGLGNKGLVKRAYKDLESAEISAEYSESSVEVKVSEEKCTIVLPFGESKCTCPSRSICRHVITAILWLKNNVSADNTESAGKENEQTSSELNKKELDKAFADELSAYPLKPLQKAMKKSFYNSFVRKAELGKLPEMEETSILTVKLPDENVTVRIINPIEYSTCTCHSKELCGHKATAILAWQIKHGKVDIKEISSQKNEATATPIDVAEIHSVADYTLKFLTDILSDGLVRTSDDISEQAESVAVMCHNARLADCERIMREIGNRLQGYVNRSPSFSADILFSIIMDNIILLRKILSTSDEQILNGYLGEFRNTYVIADTVEILPIAQRHFSSATGYEGEIYYFLNTDTKSDSRYFTYSDVRPTFYEKKRKRGLSVAPWGLYGDIREITRSELRLENPKIANGKLSSSNETKAEIIGNVNLNQSAVYQSIYTDFEQMVSDIFSKRTTEDSETERLVLLSPQKCISSESDEITQSHSIVIEDKYSNRLTVTAKYKNTEKTFFSRFSSIGDIMLQNTDIRYVIFASAYIENGRCNLYPIAVFDGIDVPYTTEKVQEESEKKSAPHYTHFVKLFYDIKGLLCDIIQCGINSFELYNQIEDFSEESGKMGLLVLSKKLAELQNLLQAKNHTYNNDNSKIAELLSQIYNYLSIGIKQTEFRQAIENLRE